ncbi:MAG: 50S ribosomal protein L14e [Candidatus Bathyarchaeia archaeon]|nr:50S ribosomal protein L14e [Candidatus Bathyarchaeota archaeon]
MSVVDVGSICVKVKGREKGRKCVVVDVIDKNFVLVTGPKAISGVKRRRANTAHLSPTGERLNLKRGASDEEVLEALRKHGKEEFMRG